LARRYTERDVLDYLDNCVVCNPGCFFMDLEHGYFPFTDDANWAAVF